MSSTSNELEDSNYDNVKNCEKKHNTLFCIFMEYFWIDGEYPGCKGIQLIDWLKAMKVNVKDKEWHRSPKLLDRARPPIQLTDSLKSDELFYQAAQRMNKNRMYARLADVSRQFLPILIDCKNTNSEYQTILQSFIEGHLKIKNDLFEKKILKFKQFVDRLIENEVSFYTNDKNNNKTLLHVAASYKSHKILEIIVSSLTEVDSPDENGNSALHIVVDNCVDEEGDHKEGYLNIVRILISKGANLNARNCKGITPVYLAAEKFYPEMLKLFGELKADFNLQTESNENPLHFVCRSTSKLKNSSKMSETISVLVSYGCELEVTDKEGRMPIHYAAEFSTVEVIERMIKFGASVDCVTRETLLTPLYFAAKGNQLENMKLLVKVGADVNAKGLDGSTPLFMSVLWGSYESMQYLIDNGANIYQRDNVVGFTLLHLAAYESKIESSANDSEDKQKSRKIDAFIDKNFDVNDSAFCGITPLQLATVGQNFDNVKILLEKGASVNYQSDKSELTALHVAAILGNYAIAKYLIENGADVNRKGGIKQMTALQIVLLNDYKWKLGKYPIDTEIKDISYMKKFWPITNKSLPSDRCSLVEMLLENNADVNVTDTSGKTPLYFAASGSDYIIMKKLLQFNPKINIQDNKGKLPIHYVLKEGNVQKFQLLLDFAADINDNDTCELIKIKPEMKIVTIKHIIKVKLMGLPMNKMLERYFNRYCKLVFRDLYLRCESEIKKLIDSRDDTGFSLYEFLRMNTKQQYLSIGKIENFGMNLKDQFPIYSSLIQAARQYCVDRKTLLESARIAWINISNIYLPELCIECILSYLNNRYLEALIAASVSEDETIVVDERVKNVVSLSVSAIRS